MCCSNIVRLCIGGASAVEANLLMTLSVLPREFVMASYILNDGGRGGVVNVSTEVGKH
jgi:hypothetical protein